MHVDLAIAGIAEPQRGLITHAQLAELGAGRGAIAHRLETGRLHRVFRGVYVVGASSLMSLAREQAAVFAIGEGAAKSLWSAGYAWEMVGQREGDVDACPDRADKPPRARRERGPRARPPRAEGSRLPR